MYNILYVKMYNGGVLLFFYFIYNYFKNVLKVKCFFRLYGVYKGIKYWEKLELYFYMVSCGYCRKCSNIIYIYMKC